MGLRMKKKNKCIGLLLTACVVLALAGCGKKEETQPEQGAADTTAATTAEATATLTPAAQEKTAVLCTNMKAGSGEAVFDEHSYSYTGELTAETLAKGLSELTGLDYAITGKKEGDVITINWKDSSTLIKGLGDQAQKEEFHFYDANSMYWFMLDSMWKTLEKNLAVKEVYYRSENGNELGIVDMTPISFFPMDTNYQGSAFYCSSPNGQSDGGTANSGSSAGTRETTKNAGSSQTDGEAGNWLTGEEGYEPPVDPSEQYYWTNDSGEIWYWNGKQDVYIDDGSEYYIGDDGDIHSNPVYPAESYYWEDDSGDIWYWDGEVDTYVGTNDDFYIDANGDLIAY